MTISRRTFTAAGVLGLATVLWACGRDTKSSAGMSPTAPATAPAPPVAPYGELISGVVYDSGLRPLAGARVELLDGPQAGMSTTADAKGGFSLTGAVDDTTQFRASKDGHVAATATVLPSCDRCNPKRWVFFYLAVLEPSVALAGDYTLTFTADSTCTNLPDQLRTRQYEATIAPADLNWPGYPAHSDTSFKVMPKGADFPDGLNGFYLNVAGTYINLSLGDHTDPGITERVAADAFFAFGGWAVVTTTTPVAAISTSFAGWIDYCVNPHMPARYDCTPGPAVSLARCQSTRHQLSLTRR